MTSGCHPGYQNSPSTRHCQSYFHGNLRAQCHPCSLIRTFFWALFLGGSIPFDGKWIDPPLMEYGYLGYRGCNPSYPSLRPFIGAPQLHNDFFGGPFLHIGNSPKIPPTPQCDETGSTDWVVFFGSSVRSLPICQVCRHFRVTKDYIPEIWRMELWPYEWS